LIKNATSETNLKPSDSKLVDANKKRLEPEIFSRIEPFACLGDIRYLKVENGISRTKMLFSKKK